MTPPQAPNPRHVRYRVRYQACLDAKTSAEPEELARSFHRKHAAVLRYVMQWGLTHTWRWTVDQPIPTSVQVVHVLIEPALMQRVQDAAATHRVRMAAWVRESMPRITSDEVPASWRARELVVRSHKSGYYEWKFGLRLDDQTSRQLERLTQTFHLSAAEVTLPRLTPKISQRAGGWRPMNTVRSESHR